MAKQSGGNTAQRVEALVRPTVEGMGLRLWDVVFEKEGPDWYLRVLIDRDGYEALKGQKVRAKLIHPNADGVRELSGILTGREGSTVTLETENGPVTFEVNAASGVQLCDDEDLFN